MLLQEIFQIWGLRNAITFFFLQDIIFQFTNTKENVVIVYFINL